jgi:hypothetical protein
VAHAQGWTCSEPGTWPSGMSLQSQVYVACHQCHLLLCTLLSRGLPIPAPPQQVLQWLHLQ